MDTAILIEFLSYLSDDTLARVERAAADETLQLDVTTEQKGRGYAVMHAVRRVYGDRDLAERQVIAVWASADGEVVEERRYSMAEIMGAFEAIRRDLDGNFGEGTADRDRYLIGDVAHDVRAFLEGRAAWAFGLEGVA